MHNWTKPLLVCSAFLFFGVIFLLACIVQVDILAPIFPTNSVLQAKEGHNVIGYLSMEDNGETKGNDAVSNGPKIVCYLTVPGEKNNSTQYLNPSNVDPYLCTHIMVGFASVVNCTLQLGDNIQFYKDASNLKSKNPKLKVMISVGGMNEISTGFPQMTRNHANRKIFIRSVLAITKKLRLDGLDVDWEFPAWLDVDGRQRIHFVQLLHELRKAFNKSNQKLILSAAVAASDAMIDQCYNVPEIAAELDFVNLMAYDYHFYSRLLPVTGLNAPLFPNHADTGVWLTLNVNYSSNYWVEKGMPRDKIIVGIPTYGHSFNLDNADNHGLASPCNGYGSLGSAGFVSYPTICNFLKNGSTKVFQNDSRVPYAFKDREWISYDDIGSVTEKINWIRSAGFGGAMIFSLNSDDWNAICDGSTSFPLTRAIKKVMDNNYEATIMSGFLKF